MSSRVAVIALAGTSAALIATTLISRVLGHYPDATGGWGTDGIEMILGLMPVYFVVVGTVLALRQPANTVGWLCLGIGVVLSFDATAYRALGLPGADYVLWLSDWNWIPGIASAGTFLFLLFPTGHLLSPRWRVVAWAAVIVTALAIFSEAFHPGPLVVDKTVDNPFPLEASNLIPGRLPGGASALLPFVVAASALSLVLRFRRATGRERLQIKWFATAAALLALLFACAGIGNIVAGLLDAGRPLGLRVLEDAVSASVGGMPIAIGIAVLKHDLYEIDVVINRTLVYGALTATLAAAYVGSVLVLQLLLSPVTANSNLAIAVSTLAVAALFRPARARIQSTVDRRFYRRRYDAQRTLEGFALRLRDEVDLTTLDTELGRAVRDTLEPAHVSLWLAPRGRG